MNIEQNLDDFPETYRKLAAHINKPILLLRTNRERLFYPAKGRVREFNYGKLIDYAFILLGVELKNDTYQLLMYDGQETGHFEFKEQEIYNELLFRKYVGMDQL